MAVTRLKRKALRNKLRAKERQSKLKELLFMPKIKVEKEITEPKEEKTAE